MIQGKPENLLPYKKVFFKSYCEVFNEVFHQKQCLQHANSCLKYEERVLLVTI